MKALSKFLTLTALISTVIPMSMASDNLEIDLSTTREVVPKIFKKKKKRNKVTFSFYSQYLGPSLSDDYDSGATYNRSFSGQDYKGDDKDPTGSNQQFYSFSLGYKFQNRWRVSYTYSFQDKFNEVDYDSYRSDGSVFKTYTRSDGLSYNNQKFNVYTPTLFRTKLFYFTTSMFWELPTTKASIDDEMTYGIGVRPMISFYSVIPKLYHGIKMSLKRKYYNGQDYKYACGTDNKYTCTQRPQTMKATIEGYARYRLNKKYTLQTFLKYDWDKHGDEAEWDNLHKWNKHLDDVVEFGVKHYPQKGMSMGAKLQYSLNRLTSDRSAILFDFGMYL